MNSQLTELLAAKDVGAVEIARARGASSVREIEPYLGHADPAVRVLAVDCLNAAGGPSVPALLLRALEDANEQVRINAALGLHSHLPLGQEQRLLEIWDRNRTRDGFVRQQIPMIMGRLPARSSIPALQQRASADSRREVNDGIIAGLSKLGDPEARRAFGQLLRDARGKRTAELIEVVKYLDEPWVIPFLAPVLERRDIAVDLSTHRKSLVRRDCDLAVDQVLRISKARFSFALDEIAQYTDAQINEVLAFARAHPGP